MDGGPDDHCAGAAIREKPNTCARYTIRFPLHWCFIVFALVRSEESSGSVVIALFDVAHTRRPECPVYVWLCFPDPVNELFESGERDESELKIAFDLALFRSIFFLSARHE